MLDDLPPSSRFFQLHPRPDNLIDLRCSHPARLDRQPHGGASLAADQLDDVLEGHFQDVDHRSLLALTDAHDHVIGLELSLLGGRSARDHTADDGRTIFLSEGRTDPIEIQPHADGEILQRIG